MADLIISGLVALARECKDRTDTMKFVAKECGELGERIENIMPLLQDSHIKDPNYMKQVATLRNTLEEANQFLIECQESDNTKNPRASITTKSSSSTTALADPDDVLEQVVMLQCAVKKFGNDFMSSQDRKGRAVALTSRIESLAMQLHIAMTANFTRMMEENARASEANFEYHIQKEDDQIKLLRQIKRQGRARAIETSPVITVFDNMSSGAAAMGSLLIYPITMWLAPPCITEIKGDGHGTVTLPDGTVYEGSWVNGKLTGKGRMTFPSGHFYDGDFKNGLKSGNGVYSYSTAGKALFDSYNGEWKHNQMHGSGAFTYSNGDSYAGQFVNGQREGQGCYHWLCGSTYTGMYKAGLRSGRGVMVSASGDIYDGEFNNDVREGRGRLTKKCGGIEEGQFFNGKYVGP